MCLFVLNYNSRFRKLTTWLCFYSVEKKETSLKQMLSTVQKDKHKIEDTITSLDNYKKEALEKTWGKVDV